jgi:hypothetical protein
MNPITKQPGVLRTIEPDQSVVNQLNILVLVGIAITEVVAVN